MYLPVALPIVVAQCCCPIVVVFVVVIVVAMAIVTVVVVYIVYILISAFAHQGLRTMSMTCLDRPEIYTVSSGTLARLALRILKGPQWHDSFHNM